MHRQDDSHRLDSLIEQWLDDDLGPAESAELEAALIESSSACDRFWEKTAFESLLHEAVGLTGPPTREIEPVRAHAWIQARRTTAAIVAGIVLLAVGGGLGSLLTTQALAGLVRSVTTRFAVVEESFESGSPPQAKYIPFEPGVWSGDATGVVGGKWGVVPLAGARMLEFVGPHSIDIDEPAEFATEIWRVIPADVIREGVAKAAQAAGLEDGQIRLDLRAAFNQRKASAAAPVGPRAARRAKVAGLGVYAFREPVSDIVGLWNERVAKALASSHTEGLLDETPLGWQRVHVTLSIPEETSFVLVHCYVRDSERRPGAVFDGQFMDDLRISAFLEPKQGGGAL